MASQPAEPRVGLIGYGHWGPVLARNFGAHLAAVAELHPARRQAAAQAHPQARLFATAEALIDAGGCQAIAIATPPPTHAPLLEQAIEAGLHAFVEKPLTDDLRAGERLAAQAAEQHLVLMVDHLMTYAGAVEALREAIATGRLGKPRYLLAEREALGLLQQRTDVLWDLAPHDLSILNALAGHPPISVQAASHHDLCYRQPSLSATASLWLDYGDGLRAEVRVSWLAPEKRRRVAVVGDQAMAVWNDLAADPAERLLLFDRGVAITPPDHPAEPVAFTYKDKPPTPLPYDAAQPLAREIADFLAAIREHRPPRHNESAEALAVVRTLEAARRSLETGQRVPIQT